MSKSRSFGYVRYCCVITERVKSVVIINTPSVALNYNITVIRTVGTETTYRQNYGSVDALNYNITVIQTVGTEKTYRQNYGSVDDASRF